MAGPVGSCCGTLTPRMLTLQVLMISFRFLLLPWSIREQLVFLADPSRPVDGSFMYRTALPITPHTLLMYRDMGTVSKHFLAAQLGNGRLRPERGATTDTKSAGGRTIGVRQNGRAGTEYYYRQHMAVALSFVLLFPSLIQDALLEDLLRGATLGMLVFSRKLSPQLRSWSVSIFGPSGNDVLGIALVIIFVLLAVAVARRCMRHTDVVIREDKATTHVEEVTKKFERVRRDSVAKRSFISKVNQVVSLRRLSSSGRLSIQRLGSSGRSSIQPLGSSGRLNTQRLGSSGRLNVEGINSLTSSPAADHEVTISDEDHGDQVVSFRTSPLGSNRPLEDANEENHGGAKNEAEVPCSDDSGRCTSRNDERSPQQHQPAYRFKTGNLQVFGLIQRASTNKPPQSTNEPQPQSTSEPRPQQRQNSEHFPELNDEEEQAVSLIRQWTWQWQWQGSRPASLRRSTRQIAL